MTISRVKPDFALGDKLTSAEMDAIDTNATYALDKRSGQTDTLESVVSCSGAGRIIETSADGANADTTYTIGGSNAVIRLTSSITANRTYTLSTTGASTNDTITVVYVSGSYTVSVVDGSSSATLAKVGPRQTAETSFAIFEYSGSAWRLRYMWSGRQYSDVFTASGTWTCPPGVTEVILHGMGGGGGGGGGAGTGVTSQGQGGGGGGGALVGRVKVAVTPETAYTVTIGAGGTAGTAGAAGGNGGTGGDGGDTTFGALATFYGAAGGNSGFINGTSSSFTSGGPPRRGMAWTTANTISCPGQGGGGRGGASAGASSVTAYSGAGTAINSGAAGASSGAASSSSYSGGGGGGGGASDWPSAVAGAGGAGGAGQDAGAGGVGSAGTAGTLGAGGGGGGAGGTGDSSVAGGAGGAGGSGALLVIYVK